MRQGYNANIEGVNVWLTARCCGLSPACGNLAAPCVSGPIRV